MSYPITVSDGIYTSLSIMALRIFERLPISTFSIRIDSSTCAQLFILTFGDKMEFWTLPPLIIQPLQTVESSAMPNLPPLYSWAKTNFAGGPCTWRVRVGQLLS